MKFLVQISIQPSFPLLNAAGRPGERAEAGGERAAGGERRHAAHHAALDVRAVHVRLGLAWGVGLRLVSVYILRGNLFSFWGDLGPDNGLFILQRQLAVGATSNSVPRSEGAKLETFDDIREGVLLILFGLFVTHLESPYELRPNTR